MAGLGSSIKLSSIVHAKQRMSKNIADLRRLKTSKLRLSLPTACEDTEYKAKRLAKRSKSKVFSDLAGQITKYQTLATLATKSSFAP